MDILSDKKSLNSQQIHLIFLSILSLNYIIPLIIFGNITLFYHDTLDSEIVYNNVLGKIYRGELDSIELFLNGEFKTEFLRRLFHPINLFYYLFNTELAYWITDICVKLLSYFLFFKLAKKISSKVFFSGLAACLYASINDRTLDGFGFAVLPYIIYLISFKKQIRLKHFLIVAFLGANTDLIYTIPVLPAVMIISYILNRNKLSDFFFNFLSLMFVFTLFILIFNSNLIYSMIKFDDFHRASFFKETIPVFKNFLIYLQTIILLPDDFSSNFLFLLPKFLIFSTIVLMMVLVNEKKINQIFILILVVNFFIFLAGLDFITETRNTSSSSFLTFQFERISLLTPLLYSIILTLLLKKEFFFKKFLLLACFLSIFLSQINASITPTIKKYFFKLPDYRNIFTFEGYYMYNDYRKIKNLVNKNRVLSVGLDPMVAVMNDLYAIDGYHNLYPLSYKIKFRKIINKELNKDEELRKYYDNWGNRVYAFINDPKQIDLNFDEAKKIGASFIISKYKINTSNISLITLDFDNKIYLYKID